MQVTYFFSYIFISKVENDHLRIPHCQTNLFPQRQVAAPNDDEPQLVQGFEWSDEQRIAFLLNRCNFLRQQNVTLLREKTDLQRRVDILSAENNTLRNAIFRLGQMERRRILGIPCPIL
jgi:hypothetical protein